MLDWVCKKAASAIFIQKVFRGYLVRRDQRARKLKRVAKGEAKMSKEARRALLTNRINAIRDRLERETRRWLAIPIEAELAAAVAEMRALDEVPA